MKLHRFIGDFDFSKRSLEITDNEILNQLKNVLRLKSGDEFFLGDGKQNEALVRITDLKKDSVAVKVIRVGKNENELPIYGILYCSILKKENFELVVQKATEVGIQEIVPLVAKRTVKLNLRLDRLEKVIKEAAEQSGRGVLPILQRPMSFEKALLKAKENDLNLFCHPGGKPIGEVKKNYKRVGIFIGPEGGWDDAEEKAADGYQIVNLGPLTLRAETAAVVASYIALNNC